MSFTLRLNNAIYNTKPTDDNDTMFDNDSIYDSMEKYDREQYNKSTTLLYVKLNYDYHLSLVDFLNIQYKGVQSLNDNTKKNIVDFTETLLATWDITPTNVFETISATEIAIVEQYKTALSDYVTKNPNTGITEPDKSKIIAAFISMIGIVTNDDEYPNRFKNVYSLFGKSIGIESFYGNMYAKSIDIDDVFYMRVIIKHTWGYISTHVNGPESKYNNIFESTLCYDMCYVYSRGDESSSYLDRTFTAYRSTHIIPNKYFKSIDPDRRAYLKAFFEEESNKFKVNLDGNTTVNLHAKRMEHVNMLLDSYDATTGSDKYKLWKQTLKKTSKTSTDIIQFPPKDRYLYQQIYTIEHLYGLITFSTVGSAASSTASRITGMFRYKPETTGGKKTRRIRRKSATMIRHRRGGNSLRRKNNTRQTQYRRRYTRARRT